MTESEELRSEVRELKMRLRELRTENAELKIQQKRWVVLSSTVSVFSLLLAVMMFFASGDIKIEQRVQSGASLDDRYYRLDSTEVVEVPKPQQVEDRPAPPPISAPRKEREDDFLQAPDFGEDIDHLSNTKLEPKSNEPPKRGGSFALPGMEEAPKGKVIQYIVQKNDTLWNIARKMMGSSKSSNINKIMKDNGLTDSRLEPGMSLVIIVE